MSQKIYDVCLCAICKEEFTPRTGNAKYCDKCRATGKVEKEKKLKAQKRDEKKEKQQKKKKVAWSEITKICEKHHCSYGQAVARGLI